jgi:O-antigen/teichoic acid export membrane protein
MRRWNSTPVLAWQAMAVLSLTSALGWLIGLRTNSGAMSVKNAEAFAPVVRQHWHFGKWNLGGALAMWGASQLYPFLVAGFLGLRDVALLNGSIRIMGISNVINQGIEAFATPRLRQHMVNDDIRSYKHSLTKVFVIGIALMLPLCLIVMVQPDTVMRWCLGESFAHGAFTLQIIAITQFFAFLTRIATIGLNSLAQPKPGFWGQMVCAIATLAAGPWIVSTYGLPGACIALLINALVIFSIMSASFWRVMPRVGGARP